MDTTKIVKRALKGDEKAYEELFDLVRARGYRKALAFMKDEQKAEDVLQESYISAFEHLNELKKPEAFESWFLTIVGRTALNACKGTKFSRNTDMFSELENEEESYDAKDETTHFSPKDSFDGQQLKNGIEIALSTLTPDQQKSVRLYYYDGFNTREISEMLEVPVSTIKSRLDTAKKSLYSHIEFQKRKGTPLFGIMAWYFQSTDPVQIPKTITFSSWKTGIIAGGATLAAGSAAAGTTALISSGIATKVAISIGCAGIAITSAVGGIKVYEYVQTHDVVSEVKNILHIDEGPYASTRYEVADIETPQIDEIMFEKDGYGYVVKKDGKFGFLDMEGNWVVEPDYVMVGYKPKKEIWWPNETSQKEEEMYSLKSFDSNIHFYTKEQSSSIPISPDDYDSYNDYDLASSEYEKRIGKPVHLEHRLGLSAFQPGTNYEGLVITEVNILKHDKLLYLDEDEQLKCFNYWTMNGESMNQTLDDFFQYQSGKKYTPVVCFDGRTYNSPDTKFSWIYDHNTKKAYGPYLKQEIMTANYRTYESDEINMCTELAHNARIEGLVYVPENNQVRVYDRFFENSCELLFDSAKAITNDTMEVMVGEKKGIVDENLELVLLGDFEEVSRPINGRSLVKQDGEWKYINLK